MSVPASRRLRRRDAAEPLRTSRIAAATAPTDEFDAFERAAAMFRETAATGGNDPVGVRSAVLAGAASEGPAVGSTERIAAAHPSGVRGFFVRKVAASAASAGALAAAGLLALSTVTPSTAVAAASHRLTAFDPAAAATTSLAVDSAAEASEDEAIQVFVSAGENDIAVVREGGLTAESRALFAAGEGISRTSDLFVNNPSGQIQWPFSVGVPISSPYGPRWGRLHEGIDFDPGDGAPIQAVAAGTVRIATEAGGGYGVHVWIDHNVNGQVFSTHYAHMQYGSIAVTQGEQVKAGQLVGLVGNTGASLGAHLHFELEIGGSKIDPLPWLRQYAGG